jgi:hypothetical protein
MNCPVCRTALVVVEREGIEVDWCLDCRGLWFDEGELELLGELAGRSLATDDLGRREGDTVERGERRCPRCRRPMQRVGIGGRGRTHVHVDRCPDHGVWLDRGELGTILRRRTALRDGEESAVLQFLGETFGAGAPEDEGR